MNCVMTWKFLSAAESNNAVEKAQVPFLPYLALVNILIFGLNNAYLDYKR